MSISHTTTSASSEVFVRGLQQDYLNWSNLSFNSGDIESKQYMALAQKEWKCILDKYTLPNFSGESIVFGSESSHNSLQENYLSIKKVKDKTIVRTQLLEEAHYSPIYEYHLIFKKNRWYLTQIYFVDETEGQPYPGL